jgi:hypothetical protein
VPVRVSGKRFAALTGLLMKILVLNAMSNGKHLPASVEG